MVNILSMLLLRYLEKKKNIVIFVFLQIFPPQQVHLVGPSAADARLTSGQLSKQDPSFTVTPPPRREEVN